jgi:hypothetical protein
VVKELFEGQVRVTDGPDDVGIRADGFRISHASRIRASLLPRKGPLG